jgi:hypothetical protein
MRLGRAALSIVVLFAVVAIAISAPMLARARTRTHTADLIAFDTDLDVPVTLDACEGIADALIRTFVLVDRFEPSTSRTAVQSVLACAPKTSPPLV